MKNIHTCTRATSRIWKMNLPKMFLRRKSALSKMMRMNWASNMMRNGTGTLFSFTTEVTVSVAPAVASCNIAVQIFCSRFGFVLFNDTRSQ